MPEVKAVLDRLQGIGVHVSIAYYASTQPELRRNFVVESKGKMAWDIHIDNEGNVTTSTMITNRQLTLNYRRMFAKLRGSEPRKVPPCRSKV